MNKIDFFNTNIVSYDYNMFIDADDSIKSDEFAKNSSTGLYLHRGASNSDKVEKDKSTGKRAEFMVNKSLVDLFLIPSLNPDTKIYKDKDKNFNADLPYSKYFYGYKDVHVKSTPKKYNSEYSWTIQFANKNGRGGRDFLINKPNCRDIMIFVVVNEDNPNCGQLKYSAPWNKIFHLLSLPFMEQYKDTKRCIYERDLNTLSKPYEIIS